VQCQLGCADMTNTKILTSLYKLPSDEQGPTEGTRDLKKVCFVVVAENHIHMCPQTHPNCCVHNHVHCWLLLYISLSNSYNLILSPQASKAPTAPVVPVTKPPKATKGPKAPKVCPSPCLMCWHHHKKHTQGNMNFALKLMETCT